MSGRLREFHVLSGDVGNASESDRRADFIAHTSRTMSLKQFQN
jgi:hypothetical protein